MLLLKVDSERFPSVRRIPKSGWRTLGILDRARTVIGAFDRPALPHRDIRCVGCGEDSPGSFDVCWNCGAALDAQTIVVSAAMKSGPTRS